MMSQRVKVRLQVFFLKLVTNPTIQGFGDGHRNYIGFVSSQTWRLYQSIKFSIGGSKQRAKS